MAGLLQLLVRVPATLLFLGTVAASSPVCAQALPSVVSPSTGAEGGPDIIRGKSTTNGSAPVAIPGPNRDEHRNDPGFPGQQATMPGVTNVPPSGGSGSMNFPAPGGAGTMNVPPPGGAGTMNAPPSGGAGTLKPPPATGGPMR